MSYNSFVYVLVYVGKCFLLSIIIVVAPQYLLLEILESLAGLSLAGTAINVLCWGNSIQPVFQKGSSNVKKKSASFKFQ